MTGWEWVGTYFMVGGGLIVATLIVGAVGDVRDDVADKWAARMVLASIVWPIGIPVVVGYVLYRILRALIRTAFPKEGR